MADLLNKIRQVLEDGLDTAKHNAQNLKEAAEDYSKTARIKLEIHQLRNSMKKKIFLLGETVMPFLSENNFDGLKKHETLPVLVDSIKNIQNEIDLANKSLEEISMAGSEENEKKTGEVKEQIENLEKEIETKIEELNEVKNSRKKKKN
jgi:hypothetical protein